MIFNMVGGGAGGAGGGATLVVSSPANVSVTVSKDDKSYTKNSGSLGSTTFKGLATGTWTVTISGNGQTATRTIEITADYAITLAFFSATINITYPANSNCVVTNSGGQTVASDTNTTSSDKTWTATVNATGTYTVTATATGGSGNTKSESVEITSEGETKTITLTYALLLYSLGNECSETTGGWKTVSGSVNKLTDHIHISGNGSTGGRMRTANLLNLATLRQNYSKIYMDIVVPVADSRIRLGFTTKTEFLASASDYICSLNPTQATSRTVFSIDIASSDVSAYFAVISWAYETSPNIDVYRIWLE